MKKYGPNFYRDTLGGGDTTEKKILKNYTMKSYLFLKVGQACYVLNTHIYFYVPGVSQRHAGVYLLKMTKNIPDECFENRFPLCYRTM